MTYLLAMVVTSITHLSVGSRIMGKKRSDPKTVALALVLAVTGATHAQGQLPDAPGREQVVRVCAGCHEPQRVAALRLTRGGWEDVVAKMVTLGAKASDEELKVITDYLAEQFRGEAAKPLNLNTASSVELESVAALLRKEAAAWIAHRTKNGPCKSLDDLKKVAGVPFKKIDERRDRLVCVIITGSGGTSGSGP
jgi:DNA uptake protein ComE-like DNA-binding protein